MGSIPGQGTKISHERKIKAAQVVGDAEPDGLFGAKLMWIMIPVASWGAESAPYMISVHGRSQAHPSHSEPSGHRDGSGKDHAK